jgi:hypothetical protein
VLIAGYAPGVGVKPKAKVVQREPTCQQGVLPGFREPGNQRCIRSRRGPDNGKVTPVEQLSNRAMKAPCQPVATECSTPSVASVPRTSGKNSCFYGDEIRSR